jgi:hypothetical protein
MARLKATPDSSTGPRKHALQIRITPEDTERLERLQARYGLGSVADVIRMATTLLDATPAPKLRPKKNPE